MRYFIKLAYNGTHYHGWQLQPNATTVQAAVNKALSVILNCEVNSTGAGRTDAGVHAKEMFAHFDLDKPFDTEAVVHKLNSFLPADIVVYFVVAVAQNAHARFDAVKRTYQYHISTFKDVFLDDLSWCFYKKLDVTAMNEACSILLSHTNFQAFSKVNTDVNNFDCLIYEAFWTIENNQIVFTISANRFLRNMVRAIVGTLVYVGLHKISVADFDAIIKSKNRSKAGFSVPAQGLYLTKIKYEYL